MQDPRELCRVSCGGEVCPFLRRQCTAEVAGRIALTPPCRDRIAKHLAAIPPRPVRSVQSAAQFDSAQDGQQLRGLYFANRAFPDDREDVTFKETNHPVFMLWGELRCELSKPFLGHNLKAVGRSAASAARVALRLLLGSMPPAISLRASSRRSRAALRLTSG
jgi:hypothetical protein